MTTYPLATVDPAEKRIRIQRETIAGPLRRGKADPVIGRLQVSSSSSEAVVKFQKPNKGRDYSIG
jgi:hypothetical protein